MKKIVLFTFLLGQLMLCSEISGQETEDTLQQKKEQIIREEKEALKKKVLAINERYNEGEIDAEEAEKLKEEAAEIHALNIENTKENTTS